MRLAALTAAVATLTACQLASGPKPSSVDANTVRDIEQLLYLAATEPAPFTYRYRLQAAAKLSQGGQERAARRVLEDISPDRLGEEQYRAFTIQYADLLLRSNAVAEALDLLRSPRLLPLLPKMELAQRLRLHQLRAKALLLNHQPLSAFNESARAVELTSGEQRQRYQRAMWAMLQNTSSAALRKHAQRAPATPAAKGWVELALLARDYTRPPNERKAALARWRGRHPAHPAIKEPPPEIRLLRSEPQGRIDAVTLLLPLGGSLAPAGIAIRDGFLGAWYRDQGSGSAPVVRVLDTSDGDVRKHYREAIAEHKADFVIGPLSKANVESLAKERMSAPTLALNTLNKGATPRRMYQFGLNPVDELQQIVDEAKARGWRNALALHPDDDWAMARAATFKTLFDAGGGEVTNVVFPPNNRAASSKIIADALTLDASKRRATRLERLLKTDLRSQPRRREDVDFIVLIADAPQARLLSPILKYHHAGDLPALGIPKLYERASKAGDNADLNGVLFVDAPWMLEPPPLAATLAELGEASLMRMHALGAEAWHLLPWLEVMGDDAATVFHGASGRLSVDRQRRVRRSLIWAKIAGGAPSVLSPIAIARWLDPPQRLN